MSRAPRKTNGATGGELVAAIATPPAAAALPPMMTTNGVDHPTTNGHAKAAPPAPAPAARPYASPFSIFSGFGRASAQKAKQAAPPPPGPTGLPSQQDTSAAYKERVAAHLSQKYDPKKTAIPQGESGLVHAWIQLLANGIPAHAVTIWIDCTDQPSYTLDPIQGEWVAGDHPDRELWSYVRTNRRNPSRTENFVGRIRGPNTAGVLDDLASGTMKLPSMPHQAPGQQGAGGPPQAPQWPGYGGAPPNAWGVGPGGGWGGGPPHAGGPWGGYPPPPPWWWGHGPQQMQQHQQPPRELENNPALLEIWKAVTATMTNQGQGQNDLVKTLIERAFSQPAPQLAAPRDPMKDFLQYFEIMERLRPAPAAAAAPERGGMVIHRLEGGTTLVEKADGTLDTQASALISVLPDAKKALTGFSAGGALKSLFGGASAGAKGASAGANGAKPTTPQGGTK